MATSMLYLIIMREKIKYLSKAVFFSVFSFFLLLPFSCKLHGYDKNR